MSLLDRTPPKLSDAGIITHVQSEPDMQKALSDTPDTSNISIRQKRPRMDISPDVKQPQPPNQQLLETIRLEIRAAVSAEISANLKICIADELSELKEAVTLIRKLEASVQFMSDEFDRMKSMLNSCEDKNQQILKENSSLKKTVSDLSMKVNLLEQNSRQQNLEINGVSENKAENLVKTVVQLGKAVSSTLKEEDVVSAMRVRKMDPQNTNPRAVIVKLRTSFIRDEVLTAVMNYNKTNANDKLNSHLLGYGGPKKPIFVSEHLSPLNKEIHAATRKAARDKGYKYVWVRDGRVLVRKADGHSAKQVRSLDAVALL